MYGGFHIGDARAFFGLTSKFFHWFSMQIFDAVTSKSGHVSPIDVKSAYLVRGDRSRTGGMTRGVSPHIYETKPCPWLHVYEDVSSCRDA